MDDKDGPKPPTNPERDALIEDRKKDLPRPEYVLPPPTPPGMSIHPADKLRHQAKQEHITQRENTIRTGDERTNDAAKDAARQKAADKLRQTITFETKDYAREDFQKSRENERDDPER